MVLNTSPAHLLQCFPALSAQRFSSCPASTALCSLGAACGLHRGEGVALPPHHFTVDFHVSGCCCSSCHSCASRICMTQPSPKFSCLLDFPDFWSLFLQSLYSRSWLLKVFCKPLAPMELPHGHFRPLTPPSQFPFEFQSCPTPPLLSNPSVTCVIPLPE